MDIAETGATQASFATDVAIAQRGGDTEIRIGANTITLVGIEAALIRPDRLPVRLTPALPIPTLPTMAGNPGAFARL